MKVRVTLVVDVNEKNVKELGYSNVEEYLDDCTFVVHDADENNIYEEVEEYNFDDDDDDDYDDEDDFDDDFNENENEEEDFE